MIIPPAPLIPGDIDITDGIMSGSLNINGQLDITGTTDATNASTGALVISGGAGISQDLYVGGNIYINGTPVGGGIPGGDNTQVQYNSEGNFAGSSNLVFDGTNLTSGGKITANSTSTISPFGFGGGAIVTPGGITVSKDIYIGASIYLNDESSIGDPPYSMGEATLPGGSPNIVNVSGTTLNNFSRVFLTVRFASGTLGNIYVSNQSNGSFDINSDSTTDTSIISWMVVRYVSICFYAESTVELESGKSIKLRDLKHGDHVLSHMENGTKVYSEVISFSGWDLDSIGASIEITTGDKHNIIVSDNHLVYNCDLNKYIRANKLSVGDYVLVNDKPTKILGLLRNTHAGWISPLTKSGKIQVNGFAVSCHTHDSHDLVRFIYLPLRLYLKVFPNKTGTQPKGNSNFSIYYRRGLIGRFLVWLLQPFF